MKYISTRGRALSVDFSQIVLEGLASDGGLYVPETYPKFGREELWAMRKKPYAEVAFEVLKRFATDIPEEDLKKLLEATYRAEVYCHTRAGSDATRIAP